MEEEKKVDVIFQKILKKLEVPTGIAKFPKEMSEWPPRSYIDRIFNVTHIAEMPKGGHFAALEQPDLLIEDIKKFVRGLNYNPYDKQLKYN